MNTRQCDICLREASDGSLGCSSFRYEHHRPSHGYANAIDIADVCDTCKKMLSERLKILTAVCDHVVAKVILDRREAVATERNEANGKHNL